MASVRIFLFIVLASVAVLATRAAATATFVRTVSVSSGGIETGNDFSFAPVSSADGTIVAFCSTAFNLGSPDTNRCIDVYVRNLTTGVTRMVSVNAAGTDGGNANSFFATISADGTHVAFISEASDLDPRDTNGQSDVYVRNLQTGVTSLISVNAAGNNGGNDVSIYPTISADGSTVAFVSLANDLGPTDTNGGQDVYVREIASARTHLVSVNATGSDSGNHQSSDPLLSEDGQTIAFSSFASDLATNDRPSIDPGITGLDVFVRRLSEARGELVSVNAVGFGSDTGLSFRHTISADGNHVAFASTVPDLTPNDINAAVTDCFARDLRLRRTVLVSRNRQRTGSGNFASDFPQISANGKSVAFVSVASNLVPVDTNGNPTPGVRGADVFVRDLTAPTCELVSVNAAGRDSSRWASSEPSINADGTVVVFSSFGRDFGPNDTNGLQDIYRRNRATGETTLLSVNRTGENGGNRFSRMARVSPNGKTTVFESEARDLAPTDRNGGLDVFQAVSNNVPLARNDTYRVRKNSTLRVGKKQGVLRNDRDADSDPLTAAVVSAPQQGTLVLHSNGSFTYRPRRGFKGRDRFTYRASDPTSATATATVTLNVKR
jgi:Tol biopolymer transport system component